MIGTAPRIDSRNQEILVKELRKLLLNYCPEWNAASIETDKRANAMLYIFSRMMETIIQRLNKVPEKNFLTFLDLMGVRMSPPRIARAPLTFKMVAGAKQYGSIPAGSQVATEKTTEEESSVFETENDLTVILPGIARAVSISPADDSFEDHSAFLFTNEKQEVELFKGKKLIPHRLYIGHNELFALKERSDITLKIAIVGDTEEKKKIYNYIIPDEWEVKWYYFDENSNPAPLIPTSDDPHKVNLLKGGDITFQNLAGISEKIIGGIKNNWIFAELNAPIPEKDLPEIASIKVSLSIPVTEADTLPPEKAFFNTFPVDLTRDFYPFGDKPKFNNTFYIGSKEVFSKENADIFIKVQLSEAVDTPDSANIVLLWEFWNGKSWKTIAKTSPKGVSSSEGEPEVKYKFKDSTNAFTIKEENEVSFTCPKIEASEINGEKNHWVRVRIIGGNYGIEATYREQTEVGKYEVVTIKGEKKKIVNGEPEDITTKDKIEWAYVPPTYKPPSLSKFSLGYGFNKGADPQSILIYNDFAYEPVNSLNKIPFKPFKPSSDKEPALYLGFDGDISTLPVTLFFPLIGNAVTGARTISLAFGDKGPIPTGTGVILRDVSDLQKGDVIEFRDHLGRKETKTITRIDSNSRAISWNGGMLYDFSGEGSSISVLPDPPLLSWEYWTGKTWSFLSFVDKTNNLKKREMVQFLAPFDLAKRTCFGEEFYWIRGRLDKGNYDTCPKLKGIYTNTVWAYNRITVENETLGSSSGKPGQILNLSLYPVLPGQELFITELSLTEDEKNTIIKEEGKNAASEIIDEAGNVTGFLVRWHEVGHFYFSRPGSRHYMIDRNTGSIIFGDGVRGMIPQGGKDNIKCSYRSGGGVEGNVKAGKITKPRTSFPYIDSVTNVEAADGGGDVEDTNRLKERGPQTLKHGDRAVTSEDFLWLVREASPKVAKVKCLPTTSPDQNFKPGWITLIVVPDTEDIKPLPTEELINNIQEYLFQRTSTFLIPPAQINITGPGYIRVGVDASVQFTSITEAKTIEGKIIDNLTKFFHPLRGGTEEKGWEFGRAVHISEVYEVIENTQGVDHVENLSLNASTQHYTLSFNTMKPSADYPARSFVSVGKKYLFDWDEIPGDDTKKFKEYLIQNFGVSWIKKEKINKIDNGNAILFSKDNRYVSLRFDSEKTRAILTIDNIPTDEFIVKTEKGKKKIYDRSTFSLAHGLSQEETDNLTVTGFKDGDNIILRNGDKRETLVIRSVFHEIGGDILEFKPFSTKYEYPAWSIVETLDKRIRSFILNEVPANSSASLLKVAILETGDNIVLSTKDETSRTDYIEITEINDRVESIFIDDNYLVYSGAHSINKNGKKELIFPYLVNVYSKETHDLENIQPKCNFADIKNEHKKFIKTLDDINGFDYCRWCFGAELSKR
jgi:hypothetical protein